MSPSTPDDLTVSPSDIPNRRVVRRSISFGMMLPEKGLVGFLAKLTLGHPIRKKNRARLRVFLRWEGYSAAPTGARKRGECGGRAKRCLCLRGRRFPRPGDGRRT